MSDLILAALICLVAWYFLVSARPTVYAASSVSEMSRYLSWLKTSSRYGVVRIFCEGFNLKVNLRFWSEDESTTEIQLECLSGALTRAKGFELKKLLSTLHPRMRYFRKEYPPRLILWLTMPRDQIVQSTTVALEIFYDSLLPETLVRRFNIFGEGDIFGPRHWRRMLSLQQSNNRNSRFDQYLSRKFEKWANRPAHPADVWRSRQP